MEGKSKILTHNVSLITSSIPQRLSLLQHVLNALQSLALSAKAQKCLALQVQNILLADLLHTVAIATTENVCQPGPDGEVVVADEASTFHLMHTNFQRCQTPIAES